MKDEMNLVVSGVVVEFVRPDTASLASIPLANPKTARSCSRRWKKSVGGPHTRKSYRPLTDNVRKNAIAFHNRMQRFGHIAVNKG
ncbi:unnamed protein product [Alternaria burnsii]|nr:unnamed protein product [Alternaria burnsii]